jgi:hypothetical protein
MNRVNDFSEKMLLHYASPNRDLIVEIMQFDANNFSTLLDEHLSKYILVLGQYLVMLQHNDNLKNVERVLLSKSLEHALNVEKLRSDIPSNLKTEKDKRAWLLANREELLMMENEFMAVEAESTLIAGMNKAVEALLNALKKEKSARGEHS